MKSKKLAIANGVIGISGGVLLLIFTIIFWSLAIQASYSNATTGSYEAGYELGNQHSGLVLVTFLCSFIIIVASFILGIVALNYYKSSKMSKVPHILLIIGASVAIIPLVGKIVGSILLGVGGIVYLVNLKKLDDIQVVE